MVKSWNTRQRIVVLSILLYGFALALPSYTFVTPDHRINTHQIGLQSLLSPPIGIAYVVNAVYLCLMVSHSSKTTAPTVRKVLAWLLIPLLGLTMFGFSFGDPEPGSIVRYGSGATLWLFSLVTGIVSGLRPD